MRYKNYIIFKNLIDRLFAFLLLCILFPFFIMISILVFVFSGRPIFFVQKRITIHKKEFYMVKFRTMKPNSNTVTNVKINDNRLTKIGKILRKFSLDELPQILNILLGHMSFIGPRPILPNHPYKMDLFPPEYSKRFDLKAGLTGYAQVKGRNDLKYDEKFYLDCKYVDKISFFLDLQIFFQTIIIVIIGKGVYDNNERK